MSRVVWTSDSLLHSRGWKGTLASVALHFDTKILHRFAHGRVGMASGISKRSSRGGPKCVKTHDYGIGT